MSLSKQSCAESEPREERMEEESKDLLTKDGMADPHTTDIVQSRRDGESAIDDDDGVAETIRSLWEVDESVGQKRQGSKLQQKAEDDGHHTTTTTTTDAKVDECMKELLETDRIIDRVGERRGGGGDDGAPSKTTTTEPLLRSDEDHESSDMSRDDDEDYQPAAGKRNIFSAREKMAAVKSDSIIGTTMVVANDGEMIGSIRLGKVISPGGGAFSMRPIFHTRNSKEVPVRPSSTPVVPPTTMTTIKTRRRIVW